MAEREAPATQAHAATTQGQAAATSVIVGVVGAGTMGAGIAQVALQAGHIVRLYDVDPAALDRARVRSADGLMRRAIRDGLQREAATRWSEQAIGRLTDAAEIETVAEGAGLVIEAAREDLATKRRIFETLDRVAPTTAILATNTSAISVEAIAAAATTDRSRVIGLHFFNPAPRMALVEVVRTPHADEAVIERATALMTAWGKTPVVCADSPGFIVNRVNRPFTLEALSLVETGVASVPRIDAAMRDAGFPMGPFELMDLIGIDINLAAARGLFESMDRADRFRPSPIQERLVGKGHLGRKTGGGCYRYDEAGRALGVDLTEAGSDRPGTTDEEIVERIVLAVINEAFSALGDAVATREDIDLAVRLGAGHPVGPFERLDSLGGATRVTQRLHELARSAGARFQPAPALADVG